VDVNGTDRPADLPDDRDLDDGGLDLTPRTHAPAGAARSARRRWAPLVVLALLGVAIAAILVQARGASLYFKNADEAVAERDELGDTRFRLQGTVVGEVTEDGAATVFTVQYNQVDVKIRHTGSEPALFESGVPVVAEGSWNAAGTEFKSDRLLVKHDEDYEDYDEENPERLDGDESNDA
jgi:cytochrome c-type biogenesis protein CcmE